MFQIKSKGNFYNLPVSTTKSNEILDRVNSILQDETREFMLSYNNIILSRKVNYNLLEIGYSPREIIDVTVSMKKKSYYSIVGFNYTITVENDQYSTVFVAKKFFADQFYTVPENIIIKYKNKELTDSDQIIKYHTDRSTAFQVSVNKEYFLVRTYLYIYHFACLKLNSTVENLKETISMYSDLTDSIDFKCVYSDNLKEICEQNNLRDESDIDTKKLQELATIVPVFEFAKSTKKINKKFAITIKIIDDKFNKEITKKYNSTERLSLYSLTVLLERDLGIDRSLFIPFDQKGDKMKLKEFASPNRKNFVFKIFNSLNVKIDKAAKEISYLTTIKEIQEKYKFEVHNFGIIINNHYVYEKKEDNKYLIVHFMNKSKEPTVINIQHSLEPSYFITYIKVEPAKKTKTHFIIPKSMKSDKIAITYLHQNANSIEIIKSDKDEITYQDSKWQKIKYILIDKKKGKTHESIEVLGQNIRIIDLLDKIYKDQNTGNFFGITFTILKLLRRYDVAIPKFNGKILNFWDPISEIFTDEKNIITIEGFEEVSEMFILNLYSNSKTFDRISFKGRHSSAQIITEYCQDKGISGLNLNLYSDFNKLRKADIPSLFKQERNFLILNQERDKKKLIIKNLSSLQFEFEISKDNYSKCAEMIRSIFHIPEEKLHITGVINGKDYFLPSKFDAGAFPDNCELIIRYDDYQKKNQMKFKYRFGEEKVLTIDVDKPVESIKPIIQEKFKLWHLSRKAIYFSFYTFDFPSGKSIAYYQIPETVTIEIREKKETLPIQISTPENPKFENYYFVKGDTIADVIEHFQTQFKSEFFVYRDSKATKMMNVNTKLEKDMQLYIVGEQKTIKCEGSIGDDEIDVSEILTVKKASKYLSMKLNKKVYIFTKNEENDSYEAAQEDKRLYDYKEQLYAHKYFQTIDFNYVIFTKNEHISELNTIKWLREKYISKILLINIKDFIIKKNEKRLKETDTIGQVLKKFKGKLSIYIEDNIQETKASKPRVPVKKYKPVITQNDIFSKSTTSQRRYKPKTTNVKNDSDDDLKNITKSSYNKHKKNILKSDSDENEEKSDDDNEEPEDFTIATKKIKLPIIKKKTNDKKKKQESDDNDDEKNDSDEEEPEDFTQTTKKIKIPIIKKKTNDKKKKQESDDEEKSDSDDEEKSDNDDDEKSESDKEELSSSEEEEEEKITYNIQIGREAVRTIKLKKNATINDAKIKIAKEEDDIDPNCVSILFAGKNLKKTTVIEKLKLTKDDVLQVYIQNIEEILLRTAKALQVYGDGNVEENYSEYDEEEDF